MKRIRDYLKKLLNKVTSFFPEALPIGVSDFEKWSTSIITAYDLPDNESARFAIASAVMHLGSTEAYKPRRYFGLTMRKGMANQIAHAIMLELKTKQEEKIKAEKAAAEATAKDSTAAFDESKQQ